MDAYSGLIPEATSTAVEIHYYYYFCFVCFGVKNLLIRSTKYYTMFPCTVGHILSLSKWRMSQNNKNQSFESRWLFAIKLFWPSQKNSQYPKGRAIRSTVGDVCSREKRKWRRLSRWTLRNAWWSIIVSYFTQKGICKLLTWHLSLLRWHVSMTLTFLMHSSLETLYPIDFHQPPRWR